MDGLGRLLVVVEPTETAPAVLARAILLARHFLARIDLMLCARRDAIEVGERFLKGLVASVAADDVRIEGCVRTGPSIAEIVAARLAEVPADLVIKYPSDRDALRRRMWSSNDWQLLQVCDAHLLLTKARPWHPVPRFAAAIDVPAGSARSARAVLGALMYLSVTFDARTEVLHVTAPGASADEERDELRRVAAEYHLPEETWGLLTGDPAMALADAVASRTLDLLVLGAHSRRHGWREFFGTLGSRLASTVDCDLLLVGGAA